MALPSLEVDLNLGRADGQRLPVRFLLEGEGAILGVAGPSGSGKSTLLRTIVGLKAASGRIVVDGIPWSDALGGKERPLEERSVSYLPQTPCLFSHMNVRQNLLFALSLVKNTGRSPWLSILFGGRKKSLSETVMRIAERFDIVDLMERKIGGLSGGQGMKVSLARCFLKPARVYLLDEPLSGIDPAGRQFLYGLLPELVREARAQALWVTHAPEELAPVLAGIAVFPPEGEEFVVERTPKRRSRPRGMPFGPRLSGERVGEKS